MSRNSVLIKNTAIIALGRLSTQFLTFLLLPLYTTLLSASEFGVADLAITYIAVFAPTITLSLDTAAFRFLVDVRKDEKQKRIIISNIIQVTAMMSAVFVVIYALIMLFIDIPFGWVVPATVVAVMLSNMFMQFARGLGDNVKYSVASLIAGSVTILANIVLIVLLHSGPVGIVIGMLLGNLAATIYLFCSLRIHEYVSFSNKDNSVRKELLRYSIPMTPNNIGWWLISVADKTIIAIFMGMSAVGIYAVASRFPMVFRSIFSFFGLSWTETASMHINSKDRDQYFSQTINASLRAFGAMAVGMIAVTPVIFSLLVNVEFKEAAMYIPILIVGSFAHSVVGLYGAVYVAKRLTKQVANTTIVAAAISTVLSLVLIQYLGIYAVAISMTTAYAVMAIYRSFDMRKYVQIRYDRGVFLTLITMFAFTSLLYYLDTPSLKILNVIAAMLFAIILNKDAISAAWHYIEKIRNKRSAKG